MSALKYCQMLVTYTQPPVTDAVKLVDQVLDEELSDLL